MKDLDWEQQEVFRLLKNQPGTQYQQADEPGRERIRHWVKSLLTKSAVTVQFVKSDGTLRDMRCTLDSGQIPPPPPKVMVTDIQNSSTSNIDGLDALLSTPKQSRQPDAVVQRVYDLDAMAWRSFRYDRLKKITAEIDFTK